MRAAKTLLNAGTSNILILKANDYTGRRLITLNQDGSINNPFTFCSNIPIEFGSEWLYNNNVMGNNLNDNGYTGMTSIIDPKVYSGLLKVAKLSISNKAKTTKAH